MTALPFLALALIAGQGPLMWEAFPESPGHYALMQGGKQLACYDAESGRFRPRVDGPEKWGELCAPPIPPPVENHGINARHISTTPRYRLGGQIVTAEQAREALARCPGRDGAPGAPRVWITLIGPEADRARVAAEVQQLLARPEFRDRVALNSYPPDHWSVQGVGFATAGRPSVYVQAADGRVMHHQEAGAEAGEAVLAALREADPTYDPGRDPDRRKTAWLAFIPRGGGGLVPLLIVGALAALVVLTARNSR